MIFMCKVFYALILLAVLSNHMNVITAKHVDLIMIFDALIQGKDIFFAGKIKYAQLHGVHIYDSHEIVLIIICESSKNQDTRGGKLVKAGVNRKAKGLCSISYNFQSLPGLKV